MLKITYLEEEIYLEYLQESVEAWKASRTLVSLRAGASIYMEPGIACLIFPANISHLSRLPELEARDNVEITICDEEYIEVSLEGTWVSMSADSEEGVFVCDLNHRNEDFLYQLWQESQIGSSVMSE